MGGNGDNRLLIHFRVRHSSGGHTRNKIPRLEQLEQRARPFSLASIGRWNAFLPVEKRENVFVQKTEAAGQSECVRGWNKPFFSRCVVP